MKGERYTNAHSGPAKNVLDFPRETPHKDLVGRDRLLTLSIFPQARRRRDGP